MENNPLIEKVISAYKDKYIHLTILNNKIKQIENTFNKNKIKDSFIFYLENNNNFFLSWQSFNNRFRLCFNKKESDFCKPLIECALEIRSTISNKDIDNFLKDFYSELIKESNGK